uniref:RxLR effector candidate protein n=1 Tax=Hyaloperonospora arabidopsidis (strain Emoy2) TaxID=559515 RepID=M4BPV4_HYAAE|nr:RxLR effector candidate protein [Hyaloperonospora arabidopsidis Emoy2]
MTKFFLLFALVLAVSNGNRALPTPSDKNLTKLTTPSLDQAPQSELDDKQMIRVTDVTSVATGETRRLLMNKSKKKKNIFSRPKAGFKKWKPVRNASSTRNASRLRSRSGSNGLLNCSGERRRRSRRSRGCRGNDHLKSDC